MDYKEKYEQLAKFIKDLYPFMSDYCKEKTEGMISELKEYEDEWVKNEIIAFIEQSIHRGGGTPIPQEQENRWLAWLEKQGEHKSACQLDNLRSNVSFPFKAKVKSNGKIVMIHDGQLSPDGKEWIKYQSDKEDGYKVYEPNNLELVYEIEQNPAWSEEDEKNYNTILRIMRDSDVSAQSAIRLASWLKLNILQSKQEWSEEDEKRIESAIEHLENSISDTPSPLRPYVRKDIDWLRSLKQRMI